jgi:hypothetical protein
LSNIGDFLFLLFFFKNYFQWSFMYSLLLKGKRFLETNFPYVYNLCLQCQPSWISGGSRGRDCMVTGFITTYGMQSVPITTDVVSSHYVIKFVSDLQQVCGFLRVLQFSPPIKLTATI